MELCGHDLEVTQRRGVLEIPNMVSEKYSEETELTRPSQHDPVPKLGAKG